MRTLLPILAALLALSACDGGVAVSHSHSTDSVSGVREGIWPPEPLGMEDARRLPPDLRARARRSVVEAARGAVMNNPDLRDAIGERFGTFDGTLSTSKDDDVASFVFYNYDAHRTVEAVLGADGAVSVRSRPASEWQPTENAAEVERAVALARTSLEAAGHALDTLEGTAMLTYPPATSVDGDAPLFFDTRLLYVTFGPGDGEPPLYSARVDIADGTVSDGGPL